MRLVTKSRNFWIIGGRSMLFFLPRLLLPVACFTSGGPSAPHFRQLIFGGLSKLSVVRDKVSMPTLISAVMIPWTIITFICRKTAHPCFLNSLSASIFAYLMRSIPFDQLTWLACSSILFSDKGVSCNSKLTLFSRGPFSEFDGAWWGGPWRKSLWELMFRAEIKC